MSPHPLPSRPRTGVLHLDSERFEWLLGEGADAAVVDGPLPDLDPVAIAATVVERAQQSGAVPRQCVLALGARMIGLRQLRLPDLSPKELRDVLVRRAQQAAECDADDVLWSARTNGPSEMDAEGGRPWTIHVQRKSFLLRLVSELRAHGVRVARTVVMRSAVVACAHRRAGEPRGATIVLVAGRHETSVTLVQDGEVLLESVLNSVTTLEDQASTLSLVQELRNLGGWWRKTHRGEPLVGVASLGFPPELLEALRPALRAALGSVELLSGLRDEDPRQALLEAARTTSPLVVDLTVHTPARRSTRLAVAAGVTAFALCAGVLLRRELGQRTTESRASLAELESLRQQMDRFDGQEERLSDARSVLEAELAELRHMLDSGIPIASVLADAVSAFEDGAELASLSVEPLDGAYQIRVSGRTEADAVRAQVAMERVRAALEGSRTFSDVEVLPPSRLPEEDSELDFSITSQLEPPR